MAKQIVIVSGKGGTGKTVISAAFAAIAKNKVMVDADVDAADLFLLLHPDIQETHKFSGGGKAIIDAALCKRCGLCKNTCRFGAINNNFEVNEAFCEGCGFCEKICPASAIKMYPADSGEWYVSNTKYGSFVHAQLGIAEENSGKLVAIIKQKAVEIATKNNYKWIIIDGPPGVGCPAIAALGNADCAVIVAEPTLSGMHDAKRAIVLAQHFKLPVKMIINKYNLNLNITLELEKFCNEHKIEIIGKVSFSESVVQAIVEGRIVTEYPEFSESDTLTQAWNKIENTLS